MNKLIKTIIGGLVGTLAMTIIIMLAPLMGMPKMSPPDMLATTMGVPLIVGWMMHFVTGITFAAIYTYLFTSRSSFWIRCFHLCSNSDGNYENYATNARNGWSISTHHDG